MVGNRRLVLAAVILVRGACSAGVKGEPEQEVAMEDLTSRAGLAARRSVGGVRQAASSVDRCPDDLPSLGPTRGKTSSRRASIAPLCEANLWRCRPVTCIQLQPREQRIHADGTAGLLPHFAAQFILPEVRRCTFHPVVNTVPASCLRFQRARFPARRTVLADQLVLALALQDHVACAACR